LKAQLEQRQRQKFVDRHRIAHADIPGIGQVRVATLLSCGIETAADLAPQKILQVPGFGPTLTDTLMRWRRSVALGLFIDLLVLRENTYGASNITVEEGQQVISSGAYSIVRHPMYVGVLVMVLGTPLALGSWWGLLILALTVPVLVWRILDEEKVLEHELAGYTDYTHKVRYRLLRSVW
jgi:protein-S-isoprenylcysteine O-methyltransferase Ste14